MLSFGLLKIWFHWCKKGGDLAPPTGKTFEALTVPAAIKNAIFLLKRAHFFKKAEKKRKREQEEAHALAKTMMSRALPSSKKDGTASSVELQFRALESSDAVDKEMEKLKAKMLPASSKKIPVEKRVKSAKKEFEYLGL